MGLVEEPHELKLGTASIASRLKISVAIGAFTPATRESLFRSNLIQGCNVLRIHSRHAINSLISNKLISIGFSNQVTINTSIIKSIDLSKKYAYNPRQSQEFCL